MWAAASVIWLLVVYSIVIHAAEVEFGKNASLNGFNQRTATDHEAKKDRRGVQGEMNHFQSPTRDERCSVGRTGPYHTHRRYGLKSILVTICEGLATGSVRICQIRKNRESAALQRKLDNCSASAAQNAFINLED